MTTNNKQHWNNVYKTKTPNEVSWTQDQPKASLDFIRSFHVPKTAKIIDIGGGDSNLVDFLLEEGYQNITVLDISEKALEKAKKRLGEKAKNVHWIISDVVDFKPTTTYDVWHDRATFHFLTTPEQITAYAQIVSQSVTGYLSIGTFSKEGPTKCSGLPIKQYDKAALTAVFTDKFNTLKCSTEDHKTPFNTTQNFLFCSFKRKE